MDRQSEGPKFACVPCTWFEAYLQSTQPMKQQHQNSEDAGKREPSGLPKFIRWHNTLWPLVGDGIAGPKFFLPMQLTCNPTIFARPCLAEPSMLFHDQS